MTDEERTTQERTAQEEPRVPFEGTPCATMMEKMMSQRGRGCAEVMSHMTDNQVADCDCTEMMAVFGGAREEAEEATSVGATGKV